MTFSCVKDPNIPVEPAGQITLKDRHVKEKHPTPQWPSIRRIHRITSIADPGNGERAISLLPDEFQSVSGGRRQVRVI